MKNRGRSYNQEHENHSGRNSKRWPVVKRSGKPLSLQDAFDSNIVTCNKRNKAMLEGEVALSVWSIAKEMGVRGEQTVIFISNNY